MREILFRGKRKDNGEWAYGGLDTDWGLEPEQRDRYWIEQAYLGETSVLPETVGQYIGLTDKNGKKIFEGDIVKFRTGKMAYVEYLRGAFILKFINNIRISGVISEVFIVSCEVIGNIHDNPELLKGGKLNDR